MAEGWPGDPEMGGPPRLAQPAEATAVLRCLLPTPATAAAGPTPPGTGAGPHRRRPLRGSSSEANRPASCAATLPIRLLLSDTYLRKRPLGIRDQRGVLCVRAV